MSEPKRYDNFQYETAGGEYVLYTDYARINERWEFIHTLDSIAIKKQKEEIERLQAEVERLTKAGDELLHEWSSGDETDARNFKKGLVLWNAAKEGKQS